MPLDISDVFGILEQGKRKIFHLPQKSNTHLVWERLQKRKFWLFLLHLEKLVSWLERETDSSDTIPNLVQKYSIDNEDTFRYFNGVIWMPRRQRRQKTKCHISQKINVHLVGKIPKGQFWLFSLHLEKLFPWLASKADSFAIAPKLFQELLLIMQILLHTPAVLFGRLGSNKNSKWKFHLPQKVNVHLVGKTSKKNILTSALHLENMFSWLASEVDSSDSVRIFSKSILLTTEILLDTLVVLFRRLQGLESAKENFYLPQKSQVHLVGKK